MKTWSSFLKILFLLAISFVSMYVGVGGLVRANYDEEIGKISEDSKSISPGASIMHDGFEFQNFSELQAHLARQQIPVFYKWVIIRLNGFMALVITSLSFGLLGSLIFLMRKNLPSISELPSEQVILFPLYGMLTGLVVLGLSYIIPFFLTTNQTNLRPISLMFLSLISGTFIDVFYEKVLQFFKREV